MSLKRADVWIDTRPSRVHFTNGRVVIDEMVARRSVYTCAGVLLAAGAASFLAASIEWGDRASLIDPIPAEAAEQAGFVLEMCLIGTLNLAAALAIVLFRWQITWWVIVGLQVVVFLAALVDGALTDPVGWVAFSSLPLVTLIALVSIRFVSAKLKPAVAT